MPGCVKCGYFLRSGFTYFCRSCYKILVGRLKITESDFINYLNLSFKTKLTFPPDWRFPDIHYWIWCRTPSIKPLAVILEAIVFLKMALSGRNIFTRKLQQVKLIL